MLQIETSLAAATSNTGAAGGSPAPSLLIQQALEAIARISKGFNANLCTRVRPEIGKRSPKLLFFPRAFYKRHVEKIHRIHECKKNHVYQRIIEDSETSSKPRSSDLLQQLFAVYQQ